MTQIQKIIMTPKLVVGKANPPATNWEQRIDAAYDKYSKALDKVTVKTAKKRDTAG
jgi:hypothetical protein